MKKVRNLVGVGGFCVSLLLSSCGGESAVSATDTCGGSTQAWPYLVTNYSANYIRYEKPLEPGVVQLPQPLNSEFPEWNAFSLKIKADYQRYQAKASSSWHFSLFAQAMACSQVLTGKQKLTKISITSGNDFNDNYPAGSELISLFESMGYPNVNLTSLLVNSPAPLELNFKLIEAPQFALQSFDVQITLDDGSVFLVKTGDVYFKLP